MIFGVWLAEWQTNNIISFGTFSPLHIHMYFKLSGYLEVSRFHPKSERPDFQEVYLGTALSLY